MVKIKSFQHATAVQLDEPKPKNNYNGMGQKRYEKIQAKSICVLNGTIPKDD